MKPLALSIVAASACLAIASSASAQLPYVTYYQPRVVYYAPVAYAVAAPVVGEAVVTPQPTLVPGPVAAPAPMVVQAPVPMATVAYYPAPRVVYQPTAQVITRYRPILGGTVSRVRYGYTPVVY